MHKNARTNISIMSHALPFMSASWEALGRPLVAALTHPTYDRPKIFNLNCRAYIKVLGQIFK